MKSRIRRFGAAVAVVTPLVAALVGAPAASASAQSCTHSKFTVIWQSAGVYQFVWNGTGWDANLLYSKSLGDQVQGPTGNTGAGWTQVFSGGANDRFMKDAALRYDSCS